jgi:hypothetical protein
MGPIVTLPPCLVWHPTADIPRNRRNLVVARLSGRFNGVAFDVGYTAEFRDNASDQREKRVLTALQAVIDKALTEVVERLNRSRPGAASVAAP